MFLSYLFLLHFIADFVLQSREMGTKKSTSREYFWKHIGIITAVFLIGTFDPIFALLNAGVHALIDAHIWTFYKWSVWKRNPMATAETWRYWEDYYFYLTIGLDQLLHGLTIILFWNLLT